VEGELFREKYKEEQFQHPLTPALSGVAMRRLGREKAGDEDSFRVKNEEERKGGSGRADSAEGVDEAETEAAGRVEREETAFIEQVYG